MSVAAHGQGAAHAKAILVGEHWVLDGCPALALALPQWQTEVRWGARPEPLALRVEAADGAGLAMPEQGRAAALAMLAAACDAWQRPVTGGVVSRSTIPVGLGVGSSAAFAVAALRALAARDGLAVAAEAVLAAARVVEAVVHGRSSGLDPAAAMTDAVAIRFADGAVQAELRPAATAALAGACWLIADVGPAPATAVAVATSTAARAAMAPPTRAALVDATIAAVDRAEAGLASGDLAALGAAMDAADAALRPLGVVDARMATAIATLRRHGALGAKQSGAGLGGVVLGLASDARSAATCAQALRTCCRAVWVWPLCPTREEPPR